MDECGDGQSCEDKRGCGVCGSYGSGDWGCEPYPHKRFACNPKLPPSPPPSPQPPQYPPGIQNEVTENAPGIASSLASAAPAGPRSFTSAPSANSQAWADGAARASAQTARGLLFDRLADPLFTPQFGHRRGVLGRRPQRVPLVNWSHRLLQRADLPTTPSPPSNLAMRSPPRAPPPPLSLTPPSTPPPLQHCRPSHRVEQKRRV